MEDYSERCVNYYAKSTFLELNINKIVIYIIKLYTFEKPMPAARQKTHEK